MTTNCAWRPVLCKFPLEMGLFNLRVCCHVALHRPISIKSGLVVRLKLPRRHFRTVNFLPTFSWLFGKYGRAIDRRSVVIEKMALRKQHIFPWSGIMVFARHNVCQIRTCIQTYTFTFLISVFCFLFILIFSVPQRAGYLDQGLLVRDAAKLRDYYFTTKAWRLDFLSILPTDLAYFWWKPDQCDIKVPCPVIVRLNRLFRLPRMLEWFERTETNTGYPNAFRICKVSMPILNTNTIVSPHFW